MCFNFRVNNFSKPKEMLTELHDKHVEDINQMDEEWVV